MEPKGVEYGRLNMENDTLMRQFANLVQRGLGYPMHIRRLDENRFTSKALRDTIAALKTTPNDIVILYYSGYGIGTRTPNETFANWRLNDVKDTGLPLNTVENWLKAKNVQLALLIADCTTERMTNDGVSASLDATIDLTSAIMKQLFLRNKGIVRLGSSAPSLPGFLNPFNPGTLFTSGLYNGFDTILRHTQPAALPFLSFKDVQRLTNSYMSRQLFGSGTQQVSVLEVKNWDGSPVRERPSTVDTVGVNARWQGFIDDEYAYNNLIQRKPTQPNRPLPLKTDLSRYAPPVINQGDKGNCVAIATGYYMRSILEAIKGNITNKDQILKRSFSPFYLYSAVKHRNDKACTFGIEAGQTLEYLKQTGLPRFSRYPDPGYCQFGEGETDASSRIRDYVKLFNITDPKPDKVLAVKQALAERSPVVVGVQTTRSMQGLSFIQTLVPRLRTTVWELVDSFSDSAPERERPGLDMSWKPYEANSLAFGHAMCVVGYDDAMILGNSKGAFKLINSWGSGWGDGGYFWMSYDTFGQFTKYGYQAYLNTDVSPVRLDTDVVLFTGASRTQPAFRLMPTDTSLTTYTLNKPLRTGTKLTFRVDTKKQTYLYLLTATESDSVAILQVPALPRHLPIAPNNRTVYPTNQTLELKGKPGLEYMLFLFSDRQLDDMASLVQTLNQQKGPFPQRVKEAFGNRLVPNRQVQYKPKKMGFFLPRTSQVVDRLIPLLITINHVR